MTGVVLSGGQSSRMGSDKGLMMVENKSWVKHAFEKLETICDHVVVSVNDAQKQLYANELGENYLVADDLNIAVHGPLLGLLSVHVKFNTEDLMVLACDMVAMHEIAMNHLEATMQQQPGYDVYVYRNDEGAQPVVGIYTSQLLAKLLHQSNNGLLQKFSLKHVLEISSTCFIAVPEEWDNYFVNYNYREDIDFQ